MIFSNIGSNEIQLFVNLAGIIIETEEGVFSEIINNPQLKHQGDGLLDIGYLLDDFQEYPKHPSFPFARNSFDIMMILTRRELQLGLGSVFGWHRDVPDIFDNMMDGQVAEVPTVIARKYEEISYACFAAREMGKVLGINKNDDLSSETNEDGDECFGMMQPSNYYCSECYKWNYQSITQLELFMSQNVNRCFLLNYPRSLDPPKTRRVSLTPQRQCECYGYCRTNTISQDDSESMLSSRNCSAPLKCKSTDPDGKTIDELTILPLDGTPCSETRVCWNKQCVSLTTAQPSPNNENNETIQ